MICNRSEIAEVLGVHMTTIDSWVKEGMPFLTRPDKSRSTTQWKFDTAACVKWLVNRAGEGVGMDTKDSAAKIEQEAKARERLAIAGLKELELAAELKVMVHVDDVTERVEEEYAIVKSRLQAIPGRMAHDLAATSDPAEVERKLKVEVSQALEELSSNIVEAVAEHGA